MPTICQVIVVNESDKLPCLNGAYILWPPSFIEQICLSAYYVPDVVPEMQR